MDVREGNGEEVEEVTKNRKYNRGMVILFCVSEKTFINWLKLIQKTKNQRNAISMFFRLGECIL